ncbi:hypothetical protein TNCV_3764761 [Trichonephila clavipes]|uniref:Endonuclease/exonuclease/phosphatase domain-containing protein n=1 Tax=Trichonephila clavipes TaxID=2585209 RepID=A0A8X7B8K5_TRICX|nr:hypothetical protein TNCV_3764761 [Trichonephila clavipes]
MGDFNAKHSSWGCDVDTRRGITLNIHMASGIGQNNFAGTATDEVCRPVGRSPLFLRSDWPRPFARRKMGVEMDWVDPKINDPRQGDLE